MRFRSRLCFRLRGWLGLRRSRSRSWSGSAFRFCSWRRLGCRLGGCSRGLSRSGGGLCTCWGGPRSRCRLGCRLGWSSRRLRGSLSRLYGRSSGRTFRRSLRTIRLRVRRSRPRCRSSMSRNRRSDRFALRDGLSCNNNCRTPVIDGSKLLTILRSLLPFLDLSCHRGNALLARSS